ncbi:MAG TPA: VOC family protein [Bryobacteraceae bacterium]|nr:VOC family protein [Bryobacteraceae bacterium]
MTNRSVPAHFVLPHVVYSDVARAIDWLGKAFGFIEHYHYGEPPQGAQIRLGEAYVMLRSSRQDSDSPARAGKWTQSLTIFVDDVDGHYRAAKAAGARIVEEPNEVMYGERQYAALDHEGHRWLFSKHVRDVDPAEWGAKIISS